MDPIADMIIRIKNASDSRKESVVFPYSKLKLAILDILQKNGYIASFGKKGKKVVKFIEVGRLSPTNFDETFQAIFKSVRDAVRS